MMFKKFWQNMCYKIVLLNLALITSAYAQSPDELIQETLKQFPQQTQISVGYSSNGNQTYKAFEMTQMGIKPTNLKASQFQIGSITKLFTSIILADLAHTKQLDLEDDISQLKVFDTLIKQPITLKSLANHTSGLPRLPSNFAESAFKNQSNPYLNYGRKELFTYLKNDLKLGESNYQYSNLGTGLLGFSLVNITGKSYEELLQIHIAKTFGLMHTTSDPKEMTNLVKGLDAKGQLTSYWSFDALKGVGGVFSTTQDMLHFTEVVMRKTNPALELSLKPTHQINERQSIGLGWHILTTKSGATWYWHNGAVGGFTSTLVLNPETKNAVVVLSNVSAYHPKMQSIDKICFDLMKSLESK